MAMIEALPDVVVIDILTCGVLSHTDIKSFSCTSKRFRALASTNSVWKRLVLLKWWHLLLKNQNYESFLDNNHSNDKVCNWEILYNRFKAIFDQIDNIFNFYFYEDELDDEIFQVFTDLSKKFSYEFVTSVLHETILLKSSMVSLTVQYYAKKAYCFIERQQLVDQFFKLLNDKVNRAPSKENLSTLVQGTILIERFFNPIETFSSTAILDFINEACKKASQNFEAMLCTKSQQDLSTISNLKFKAINHTFFDDLKFLGNQGDYFNVNNSYIHHVIASRKGIPILLSIIYREIALRIGLKVECVNNPGHFVLRWQVEDLDSDQPTMSALAKAFRYIDVFNHGRILEFEELPDLAVNLKARSASLTEVLHRVSLNVDAHSRISEHYENVQKSLNALNLCLLFEPNNVKVPRRQ